VKHAENVNGTDAQYKDSSPENLIHLLPENHHSFYTYNGSLTTPPCYEVVTWVIMSEPVYMCQDQVSRK
jgi:carbonic anhydrase